MKKMKRCSVRAMKKLKKVKKESKAVECEGQKSLKTR